jgi:hypothetical protein
MGEGPETENGNDMGLFRLGAHHVFARGIFNEKPSRKIREG